ncbi:MAG TPA: hypothetical protein VFH44_02390 [Solirubrobacterales bacterium]|nr:hypothetical protein [Solirubrobacterales bacterium]
MNRIAIRRPSPALILSLIALFAVLGGSAYAALSKNSVGSKQIKPNAVKGEDVKESSLGKVPAAKALGKFKATNVDLTLADGEAEEIATAGPLTLTAQCRINDGGDDYAEVLISTSSDNAAFDGTDGDADFDAADSPLALAEVSNTTGTPAYDEESDGSARAASGEALMSNGLTTAVNAFGDPGTCHFGGQVLVRAG